MPPASASEKAEAGTEVAPTPLGPKPFMSSLGMVVVLVIMVLEGLLVFFAARFFGAEPAPTASIQQTWAEVDLGEVNVELKTGDVAGMINDLFMVNIRVVLNPNYENLPELQATILARKSWLRDIIYEQVIHAKPESEFRRPNILEILKPEIKKKLNDALGSSKDGQELIDKVIFPESKLPPRR